MYFKNWRPNQHLIVGLTVSTAIAAVALVVTTASQAAQIFFGEVFALVIAM